MHVCLWVRMLHAGGGPEEGFAGFELPNLAAGTKFGSFGRAARAVSLWVSLQPPNNSLEFEANLEKRILVSYIGRWE